MTARAPRDARARAARPRATSTTSTACPSPCCASRPEHAAAVLELGMSAPGELRALVAHRASPTSRSSPTWRPSHLEFFASVDAIAEAKAEILEGLRAGRHRGPERRRPAACAASASASRARVVWFGRDRRYDVSAENWRGTAVRHALRPARSAGATVDVALPLRRAALRDELPGRRRRGPRPRRRRPRRSPRRRRASRPARHRGEVRRLGEGVDPPRRLLQLEPRRRSRPRSCALGLAGRAARRVAVLGDMLELGPTGPELHRERGARARRPRRRARRRRAARRARSLEGAREAGLPPSAAPPLRRRRRGRGGRRLGLVRARRRGARQGLARRAHRAVVDALVARFGEGEA